MRRCCCDCRGELHAESSQKHAEPLIRSAYGSGRAHLVPSCGPEDVHAFLNSNFPKRFIAEDTSKNHRAACRGSRVDTSIIAHNSRCILLRGALEALENMRADRCGTQTEHWRGWRHALNSITPGMTQEFTLLHINSSLELWSYWSSRYCPADLISLIQQHLSSTLAAP